MSDTSHQHPHHHAVPPSAAGHLEPYGAWVTLSADSVALDAGSFLVAFLEGLAEECVASGATLIGHLKCLLHLPGGRLACNLTSLRAGARCTAPDGRPPLVLSPGELARLDLAVLVYGLAEQTIDGLVRSMLVRLTGPHAVSWSVEARPPETPTVC